MRTRAYPSDITDAQWALFEPHIPVYPGGRPRKTNLRDVVNAIFYILRTGCQWRYLPKDFPPKSTVWRYFDEWRHNGTLDTIHDLLRKKVRTEEKPYAPGPPPALTVNLSTPPPAASTGAGITPRTLMAASVISSWTAWGCCWRCW